MRIKANGGDTNENVPPSKLRILLCGAARNVEKHLDDFLKISERSFGGFAKIEYAICESFSTDSTSHILKYFSQTINGFHVIEDNKLERHKNIRTVRIASARTRLQEFVKENREKFDYVVMMDIDGVNRSLNEKAVMSCWEFSDWDVVTANQPFRYYDIWALRAKGWVNGDIWKALEILNPEASNRDRQKHLKKYYRSISRKKKPIRVQSAFGGLAIYKTEAFLAGMYSGLDETGKEICEHVVFHEEITRQGHKIFIVPSLVNINALDQVRHIMAQNFKKWVSIFSHKI